MRNVPGISLLLLVPLVFAQVLGNQPLLTQLGKQLRDLRAMPMSTPTNAHCPDNKDSLIGTSRVAIQQELGAPDFVEMRGASWSYFFTSPRPLSQFGGGFPELTFRFSKDHRVASLTCSYSR